jgi:hypothetical protein
MSLKKLHLLICLGLLAVVSVLAGESKEPGPMTLAEADRKQDLYLDRIQNLIVAVSDKPSKEAFSGLWGNINHAKSSDKSPFAPGFPHYQADGASTAAKATRSKSSAERQAEQEIDEAFAKALKFVTEAHQASESGQKRTVLYRLSSASKEVVKVGAVLDSVRKRRAPLAVGIKSSQAKTDKGALAVVSTVPPAKDVGANPVKAAALVQK